MSILIIDPHGLAAPGSACPAAPGHAVSRSNGILETVWMLGTELPQLVIVIQTPDPDVDWVGLSRSTCPSARIVCLPVGYGQPALEPRLQALWQTLPAAQA